MTTQEFEFGLDTVAQANLDESGLPLDGDVAIRNTVEEAVLAEAVGIDSFNVGEHYRPEFMDSAGHGILLPISSRSGAMRLCRARSVRCRRDPIPVSTGLAPLEAASQVRRHPI